MAKTLQQIRNGKAVSFKRHVWVDPDSGNYDGGGTHIGAVVAMLRDHPDWQEEFDKKATERNFGYMVDGKFRTGFSDYGADSKGEYWVDARNRWLKRKSEVHSIKESAPDMDPLNSNYQSRFTDPNIRPAIRFRGKTWFTPYVEPNWLKQGRRPRPGELTKGNTHSDVIDYIVRTDRKITPQMLDDELNLEDIGYYNILSNKFSADYGDLQGEIKVSRERGKPYFKDMKNVFKFNKKQKATVKEDFVMEPSTSDTTRNKDLHWVSAFLHKGVVHHGYSHGGLHHADLAERLDTHDPQFNKDLDDGKAVAGYYNISSGRFKQVGDSFDRARVYTNHKQYKGVSNW